MNLYGASGGHVHPASAICLGQVVYGWYLNAAVKEAARTGEHPWSILARDFGMTREEFEAYVYAHDYSYEWGDTHELQEWQEDHDPAVQLTRLIMGHYDAPR
jgi:hypothetical protein